jgi:hypothetical protein
MSDKLGTRRASALTSLQAAACVDSIVNQLMFERVEDVESVESGEGGHERTRLLSAREC